MLAWTRTRHWNRTIWRIEVEEEFAQKNDNGSSGAKYMAMRRLWRKTPAPVGGGEDGRGECMNAREWTVHWIKDGVHYAVFGLVIPKGAMVDGNERAMRYWPFQYPKVRCYRVSWEGVRGEGGRVEGGLLKYGVVALEGEGVGEGDGFGGDERGVVRVHAEKAAGKILKGVRKWAERYDPKEGKTTYKKRVLHDCLVGEVGYRKWYGRLKTKYGYWVQKWPDASNEVKYVFEEMAIAAYLLALWEQERKEMEELDENYRQSFVDIGCGNGFLVYLLMSEGHEGEGVDIESRVLWKEYPEDVQKVIHQRELVDASYDASRFDWIIGNHPDELTPWIPVIAGFSQRVDLNSRNACQLKVGGYTKPRFLILPCCFHDFDGKKYAFGKRTRAIRVQDTGQGKYGIYLDYIERICQVLGFNVEREALRIPSTKYIALVGRKVNNLESMDGRQVAKTLSMLLSDTACNR